jgi:hypothetical protein
MHVCIEFEESELGGKDDGVNYPCHGCSKGSILGPLQFATVRFSGEGGGRGVQRDGQNVRTSPWSARDPYALRF